MTRRHRVEWIDKAALFHLAARKADNKWRMGLARRVTIATLTVLALAASVPDVVAAQRGVATTGRQDLIGRQFEASVVRIADGDTLDVIPAGETRPIRLRLQGIDAPELGEVFAREAMALLRTLTRDRPVRVDGRDLDRYGRLVARVAAAGQDTSAALVRAGLACHAYARDVTLAREESQARATGLGFWASRAKKPACVTATAFSRMQQPGAAVLPRAPAPVTAPTFRGNVTSHVYHAPTCPNYTCRNCTQVFASEAEARAAGFRPAQDCLKP